MSLSLLNEYGSSDESDQEEDGSSPTPTVPKQPVKIDGDEGEGSKDGKNYFEADSSDSDDDIEAEVRELQGATGSGLIGPTIMPFTFDVSTAPIYGPPHPSQMYNYAAYDADNHGEPSSSVGYEEPERDEPVKKRPRSYLSDEDAKKLIKRYEMDSMGLAMPDNLEIIDAHVDTQLSGVRENLVKNITTTPTAEAAAAALMAMKEGKEDESEGKDGRKGKKKKDNNAPAALAKRKHQITYLAHLAKTNEEKLQNEWAKNRVTKRQTQAKYGF